MERTIEHELYMKRALELAWRGKGKVAPNPMVGCVIVKNNRIVGEGWHKEYGGPHAEVNAINSVKCEEDLINASVYVSLEPCSHFGKTPPCADLLASLPIKEVFVASEDVNPQVSGEGIIKIEKAAKTVWTGLHDTGNRILNKEFFSFHTRKRPYVYLKWAETADGFIARENYDSKWISNSLSRMLVHKWRSEIMGILVGKNTAKYDNPSLNVRSWSGKNPVRIILDRNRELSPDLQVFADGQGCLVYNTINSEERNNITFIKVGNDNFIAEVIMDLGKRGISSVLIEGGATVLQEVIKLDLWDEAFIFRSSVTFISGVNAPEVPASFLEKTELIRDNILEHYINKK